MLSAARTWQTSQTPEAWAGTFTQEVVHSGIVIWESIRHRTIAVACPADNDGFVRVCLEEIDYDFLSDPLDEHRSPASSRPELSDAYPARAILVHLAFQIPVELDFAPPFFIHIDLFAAWPDHDSRLSAPHPGLSSHAWGAIGSIGSNTLKLVFVAGLDLRRQGTAWTTLWVARVSRYSVSRSARGC